MPDRDMTPVLENHLASGLMRDPAGLTIWDVGCGNGRFTEAFIRLGAGRVLATDLKIPAHCSSVLQGDSRVELLLGDADAACRAWGRPLPVDLVFMSLMTEHVAEPRAFLHNLAEALPSGAEAFVEHDNFFQPVGHHDHGLLFLNDRTSIVEPQGIACWERPERCDASAEHRKNLIANSPLLWSETSEATRDPANCTGCNYYRRSQPWAHLVYGDQLLQTFPETFFSRRLNRIMPDQLKWFVQEAGFLILNESRSWVMNAVPNNLALRYGQENLSTFTIKLRLRKR